MDIHPHLFLKARDSRRGGRFCNRLQQYGRNILPIPKVQSIGKKVSYPFIKSLKVIQVVKRFGICGGMEEYAYRLSHELNKLSIHVSVVCERIVNDPFNADFPIFELGETRKKPRWWSHLQFARRVREWVADNDISNTLIHSHERIDCHNVTTIHQVVLLH